MTALLLALTLLTASYTAVIETDAKHAAMPDARAWRVCGPHRITTIYVLSPASMRAWVLERYPYLAGAQLDDYVVQLIHQAETWERAGAMDCRDDGVFNGSTVPGCDVDAMLKELPNARLYATALREYDAKYGTAATGPLLASECASNWITRTGLPKGDEQQ